MEIMFDRLMLVELRDNVSKLDNKAFAELKAYNSPPTIVLHILRATLAIFYKEQAAAGAFDDWNVVRTVGFAFYHKLKHIHMNKIDVVRTVSFTFIMNSDECLKNGLPGTLFAL